MDEATGEVKWAVHAPHSGGERYGEDSRPNIAMSPGGRFVASVGWGEQSFTLWDAASGAMHRVGSKHDGSGPCICVVTQSGHRFVQTECPVVAHTAGLRALAFSPCGQRLATGSLDGAVILWDVQTGKAVHRMVGQFPRVSALSFSADGARLACGSVDGSIRVWNATGSLLLTSLWLPAHEGCVHGVNFSPTNSRNLVSVSEEIRLWDVESGAMTKSFEGCAFAVFSPDGRSIATNSTSDARVVHLVDAETGIVRARFLGLDYVSSVSFSPDGSKLASGSQDGTCRVWDSSSGALLRTIHFQRTVHCVVWGCAWSETQERGQAFAMGQHPRLGAGSQLLVLDVEVVRMILDRTPI